jgi:hypothetical protein
MLTGAIWRGQQCDRRGAKRPHRQRVGCTQVILILSNAEQFKLLPTGTGKRLDRSSHLPVPVGA